MTTENFAFASETAGLWDLLGHSEDAWGSAGVRG